MNSPTRQRRALIVRLIDEIMRGHGRFVALSNTFAEAGDPTGLMQMVLTSVVEAPLPPTVPQIGRSLGYPRQTIQRQADALVADGLLDWIDNPDHKKARRLIPTEAGRAAHARAETNSRRWTDQFTARMDAEDIGKLEQVVETLGRLRKQLEADLRAKPGSAT